MAFRREQPCNYPAKAETDLSAKQFHAVELSGNSQVDVTDDEVDVIAGILQNKPVAGQWANICPLGITKVRAGIAITAGSKIIGCSGGWVRPIAATGSGKRIIGFCIEGVASGGVGVAFLNCANAVSNVTSVP